MAPPHRLLGALLLPCILGTTVAPLAGQDRAVTQLQTRAWSSRDGVPMNAVTGLAQTPDGYLWVATEGGLARFDGASFVPVDAPEAGLHTSSHITAVGGAPGGGLWIGTTSGLIRLVRGEGTRWDAGPDGLRNAYVQTVRVDTLGRVWVGTVADGLFLLTGDGPGRAIAAAGLDGRSIRDVSPSRGGLPWVATDEGLARVAADTTLVLVAGAAVRDARAVLEDRRGRVWVGTREGLYRLQGGRLVPATGSGPLSTTLIRALVEDRGGTVWAASSGDGLYRLAGDRWERLGAEHGLPSDDVHALLTDARGDLWTGANGGVGLVYAGEVLPITPAEGLSGAIALPILEDRGGALWVGTFDGGLNRIDETGVRVFGTREGLPHDVVLALAEDPRGRIWIGTRTGIGVFDGGRIRPDPTGVIGQAGVTAILATRDGTMWLGTTEALYAITGSAVRAFGVDDGLATAFVLALGEASDGSVLVGTQGGGAYRIRNGRVERLTDPHETQANVVYAFHEADDGSIWLGTGEGLVRIRGEERAALGLEHGLPDPSTARILDDGIGHLWISTNRGVYRTTIEELNAVADRKIAAISPRIYTERDGMPSAEANTGFYPAGWRGRDGRLFFPTMAGVAVFDPATMRDETAPLHVVIDAIDYGSGKVAAVRATDLPPQAGDVSISYTAVDFRHGDLAEFRYRLIGYDTAWVAAGQRRTAYYTRVPPGRYTFAVEGRLPGRAWETADPLGLQLRPYFHETLWFRLAAALLVLLVALGLHRWRVESLRRREKELMALVRARESAERRYRQIFENAQALVITFDPLGRIEEANREACSVLERDPETLVGMSLESLGPADIGGDARSIEAVSAVQGVVELTLLRPDGSPVRIEASARELREDGRQTGYQLIGRDVSERQDLEARLRQSQRMEAVGLLAGGVAHDFNNILSVIGGYTSLLLQDLGDSHPLREDALEISMAADRATALTHQLLAFSRRQTLEPRVIQPNEVVAGTESLLRRLIGEDIEIVLDLAPDLWHVTADSGQMEQVITNLALNARDAMPDGGTLTIASSNLRLHAPLPAGQLEIGEGDYVVLSVADSGTGMSDELRERIFDPFFTTKEVGKGTGLGLATVHGIVEQSGGHIRVASAPGKGSTFHVYLPRERRAPEREIEPVAQPAAGPGDETVLVVDDDESVRRLVRRVLERNGYHVLEAADPLIALEDVLPSHQNEIQLLVTDVVMPHMSGPELAQRIAAERPAIHTIFMSGYTDDKLAATVDIHVLLRKPFAPDDLLRKVREVLAG